MPDLYLKRYKDKTCTPAERLGDDIAFKYNECHSFEEDFYFYGMRYQRDAKSKPHPKGTQCKIHMWSRWDCQGTFIGQFLDTSDPGEISPCLSTAFLGTFVLAYFCLSLACWIGESYFVFDAFRYW